MAKSKLISLKSWLIMSALIAILFVFVHIHCLENEINFELVYPSWNDNWFGLIFNDEMHGNVLIYTTGKAGEDRNAALYAYDIEGRNAEDIIFQNEWTRIGRET